MAVCLEKYPFLKPFLAGLSPECESAFKQMIAAGQADRVFSGMDAAALQSGALRELLSKLLEIDQFYRELGGIVGYQAKVLELLNAPEAKCESSSIYHSPYFIDMTEETEEVDRAISWGIEALPEMAEFYPLGGAADRLHLVDEATGTELPAAKLPFAGRTLLEGLIRDLQAREYVYYRIHGKQETTPIAVMTSHEKNNHAHVLQICESHRWFGRPRGSFRFFTQPLVPAVNERGEWCAADPLKPLLKPGGHGALWKLARDQGIFDWLASQNRKKTLVRQINNPIAGLDYGLLAFTGFGWKQRMIFGFASCPRLLQAAEGVNVLIERNQNELVLTNIEYCDFAKFGIEDRPLKEGEPYSRFSSNTNILFADLEGIAQAVAACPFPGLLMNMKTASYSTLAGEKREEKMGRLESTMQNIADVLVEPKNRDVPLKTEKTFVTYNRRQKTISTAKKAFVSGKPAQETPENCFYDLLSAHRDLLSNHCGVLLPEERSFAEYLQKGPSFLFLYHPALGPLYSMIRKKIRGGRLAPGSELILEIAEASLADVDVDGSLQVIAEEPLGRTDENGILRYSSAPSECRLRDVYVVNRGVDWAHSSPYWKMELKRFESLRIILKGRSAFIAEGVRFSGDQEFVVEDGFEMRVSQKDGKLSVKKNPLK